ncbi:MAG: NIPSNAP family protein [Alphaproteobacteria bacterium]
MVVDQRTYTLKPGTVPLYLKTYMAEGRAIQMSHLGTPFYYSFTEFGALNQIVHMWSYKDAQDRADKRAKMQADSAWTAYTGKVRDYLVAQENKLLMAAPFFKMESRPQGEDIAIIDHRTYTLKAGTVPLWMKAYGERGKAIQTKHIGEPYGYFFTEFGALNQVIHMWGYKSPADRDARRAKLAADPDWAPYLSTVREHVVAQENKLLIAAPFMTQK